MNISENVQSKKSVLTLSKIISSQIFWVLSFSVLTALSAQVVVPVQPVPFTLQTMLVLLSGAFLGSKNGAYSQLIYLSAGVVGLPVFAGFGLGFPVLLGPTGGYLLAFPIAAYIVGAIIENTESRISVILSMIIGTITILFIGASYLSIFLNHNFAAAFFSGFAIFSIWGLIKVAAASSIYLSFAKRFSRLPK